MAIQESGGGRTKFWLLGSLAVNWRLRLDCFVTAFLAMTQRKNHPCRPREARRAVAIQESGGGRTKFWLSALLAVNWRLRLDCFVTTFLAMTQRKNHPSRPR
ncbi:MAG: hypothetical protein AB1568_13835, partial [Thermodesulfobacteriota bacterium]